MRERGEKRKLESEKIYSMFIPELVSDSVEGFEAAGNVTQGRFRLGGKEQPYFLFACLLGIAFLGSGLKGGEVL